jgi:hypothetical protein
MNETRTRAIRVSQRLTAILSTAGRWEKQKDYQQVAEKARELGLLGMSASAITRALSMPCIQDGIERLATLLS